jgi:hypothetical protein
VHPELASERTQRFALLGIDRVDHTTTHFGRACRVEHQRHEGHQHIGFGIDLQQQLDLRSLAHHGRPAAHEEPHLSGNRAQKELHFGMVDEGFGRGLQAFEYTGFEVRALVDHQRCHGLVTGRVLELVVVGAVVFGRGHRLGFDVFYFLNLIVGVFDEALFLAASLDRFELFFLGVRFLATQLEFRLHDRTLIGESAVVIDLLELHVLDRA